MLNFRNIYNVHIARGAYLILTANQEIIMFDLLSHSFYSSLSAFPDHGEDTTQDDENGDDEESTTSDD